MPEGISVISSINQCIVVVPRNARRYACGLMPKRIPITLKLDASPIVPKMSYMCLLNVIPNTFFFGYSKYEIAKKGNM